MGKYNVKLLPKAYRDIDQIYGYISKELKVPETAKKIVESFEEKILSLEDFPHRGAERKVGAYANKGYRQLFVKNFTIIYRINDKSKHVIVVTVKYSPSAF